MDLKHKEPLPPAHAHARQPSHEPHADQAVTAAPLPRRADATPLWGARNRHNLAAAARLAGGAYLTSKGLYGSGGDRAPFLAPELAGLLLILFQC